MEKREKEYNVSDIGNWNVAKEYSHFKLMRHLYLIDEYTNIAIFGSASLIEELENNYPTDVLKLNGLNRLINSLILIIDNSLFACKKGNSKKTLQDYRKQLKSIIEILPVVYKTIRKDGRSEVRLVPEKFSKVLEKVLEIKSNMNEPLNMNHLIFTDKEEFDPKKYKKQIMEDASLRG